MDNDEWYQLTDERILYWRDSDQIDKFVTENEYGCEWTEDGGYDNDYRVHYFMDFLLEEFNLDIEDLRKIAKLKEGESVKIYGCADYFTVTNNGTQEKKEWN